MICYRNGYKSIQTENGMSEIIESILKQKEKRNWELAEHLRLAGFHEIINNQQIYKTRILEYCLQISKQFPPFTKLTSGSVLIQNRDLIESQAFYGLHLPFSNKYHLMFFLTDTEEPLQKILYDSCPNCKDLESESFPHIELRQSMDIDMKEKFIFLDNRISIMHQDRNLLEQQYNAIQKFIDATKTFH